MSRPRIVIVGGGFGGVTLAQHLERRLRETAELVLVSSENHLVFSPMLAEAVGRSISPLHIVVPGRQMVRRTRWITARVTEVDRERSRVHYISAGGERGELGYDHLVLDVGSLINLSDVPGLAAYAFPLKTLGDAAALGNTVIGRLEEASVEQDAAERRQLLTVIVIGGGFSGVEVAGQINELIERARRYYPTLKEERPRVILLHRGDRILPELNTRSLSEFAFAKLRQNGVDVRLQAEVIEITAGAARLRSGEVIEAGTVVCTVGTATHPLIRSLELPLERGRLPTEPDMRVRGTENIWALGDCAMIPNAYDGKPASQTAQFATRESKQLADNLSRVLRGEPTRPFSYRPLGLLASIGMQNAVAEILGFHISGFPAWFLWRGVYLFKLPSFARKLEVAIDWAWQIFFPPNIVQLQMERTQRVGRAHYAAGEYVFHRGTPGDRFYIIESGTAGVYLNEHDAPVSLLKAGDHFGEGSLLAPKGRGVHSASIKAETPLDLLTLSRDDFVRLSESFSILHKEVRRTLLARQNSEQVTELLRRTPELSSLKICDLMSSPALTLHTEQTLEQAVARFHEGKPGYPVVDREGALAGYSAGLSCTTRYSRCCHPPLR